MAEATWEERERPILEAIGLLEQAGDDASTDRVVTETGLEAHVVGRTMKRLLDAGFIEAHDVTAMGDQHPVYIGAGLRERGLRSVGQWPPDVAEAFIRRLEALISMATDPEERSRLERLRAAASDVTKGVVSGAIVAAGQWGVT